MNIKAVYLGSEPLIEIFKRDLQIDGDHVENLLRSDDWTMMILSWAILEACLNQSIITRLKDERIATFVERMNIGGKSGKSELAYVLEILTREEKKFVDVFSEVRNRFAHGIKRFKTTFDDFFDSVSDTNKFESALLIPLINNFDGTQSTTFATDKRTVIFGNVVSVCVNISRRKNT